MKTLTTILFCLLIFVVPAFAEDLETVSGSVVSEMPKLGKEIVYNGILNYNESISIPKNIYMKQLPKNSKNWNLEHRKRRSLASRGSLNRARDIAHRANPLDISQIIEKCANDMLPKGMSYEWSGNSLMEIESSKQVFFLKT